MKGITDKIKKLGFKEQIEEIDVKEWTKICFETRNGEWDNRLGEKPEGWDNLPRYSNILLRLSGKISKQDIRDFALPKVPYIRKCVGLANQ